MFSECLWIPDLFPEADWLIWDPEAYIQYPTTQINCFHMHCNTLSQFLPKQIFEYINYVGSVWHLTEHEGDFMQVGVRNNLKDSTEEEMGATEKETTK